MTKKYMKRAIELSRIHMQAGEGGPFGAVIVKDGKIIAEGWNQVTSSLDPTAHAEITAIREACRNIKNFDLTGAEIYTSCEPCPMCLAAIYWARISKIYFANTRHDAAQIDFDDEFLYREMSVPAEDRKVPMVQESRSEALQVFAEWKAKENKVTY